jgi:glycosyltransferase involved in cell wall biosynthesis
VATNVGGVPEVVRHRESGYLAPVGAVEEMADAAVEILGDPARWREASRAAREAAERFSADVVIPRYEAYYHEVLNR